MSLAGGTVVDSNVLIDVMAGNATWAPWSAARLAEAFDRGEVVLNPIVYAELAVGFGRIEDLNAALPERLAREDLPWEASFVAGRAFREHLARGGTRRSPLPDFYIAAHAAVTGRSLLTRDAARHLRAVPSLSVISPDE